MDEKYIIRQQILYCLNDIKPASADVSRIARYPFFVSTKTEREAIQKQLFFLEEEAFIVNIVRGVPNTPDRYRIATSGMRQVDDEAAQHPYIWGPDAAI